MYTSLMYKGSRCNDEHGGFLGLASIVTLWLSDALRCVYGAIQVLYNALFLEI